MNARLALSDGWGVNIQVLTDSLQFSSREARSINLPRVQCCGLCSKKKRKERKVKSKRRTGREEKTRKRRERKEEIKAEEEEEMKAALRACISDRWGVDVRRPHCVSKGCNVGVHIMC